MSLDSLSQRGKEKNMMPQAALGRLFPFLEPT